MLESLHQDILLPRTCGLSSHQYTGVIRLSPNQTSPVESVLPQQTARTCGSVSNMLSSELEVVDWSEIFFFKIDSMDDIILELIVTDVGKGAPVGTFSAPLKQIARYMKDNLYQHNYANDLVWLDLSTTETMITKKSMDSPNPFDDSIGYVNLLNSQQDYLFRPSVAVGSSAVPLFSSPFPNDPTQPEATTPEAATVRGRRNWSPTEDVVLISGWLNTSKDALIGNEQKAEAFWKRIAAYFAASPKLVGLPSREPGNCKQRWAKINDQVSKFVGCLHAANAQKASGQNDNDVMKVANEIYLNDHGAKFTLEHCWRELRNDQKWCLASSQTDHVKSKRRKLDDGSQTSQQSSSCNVDESQPRPLGVKAAKGKGKRSTKSVEQGDKNLTQFQSMWEIKKQDLAPKDKLSDKKLLDTLLSKTEPLTDMEMTLKEKLISDMLTG